MSRRSLIAIGCDRYDNEDNLEGAEGDARRIYEALMKPEVGDYDPGSSCLLLSPTLEQIRSAVRDILIQPGDIDTLTFYFAGHGGVKGTTYYLLPSNAVSTLLSATALSAGELHLMIAEAAPLQTNIIIDACEAGGVAGDVRTLLRSEDMGATETPGVTILAMAARDQGAVETDGAGIGTTALLDCIEGRTFVSDGRAALDLLEIGTRVSEMLAAAGGQAPVLWGLNLFGPRRFCRNPAFAGGGGPLRASLGDWNDRQTRNIVETAMPRLWRVWDELVEPAWSPRPMIDEIGAVLEALPSANARAQLLERLTAAADLKVEIAADRLRAVEARAAIIVAALPFAGQPAVARTMQFLAADWAERADAAVTEATGALAADRYALLSRATGIPDLFILPLRLLRIGGLAAASFHLRRFAEPRASAGPLRRYLAVMLEQLPGAVVAISDAQAAPLACVLSALLADGGREEAETLLGSLFASAIQSKAALASPHIEAGEIFRFLIARGTGETDLVRGLLAQPSELITVLLRAARQFGLDDAFDPHLIELDGFDLNAFIPAAYGDFAADLVRDGSNLGFAIGRDIFTVSELEAAWPQIPVPHDEEWSAAILAALLLPDRTPWFLLPRVELERESETEATLPGEQVVSGNAG